MGGVEVYGWKLEEVDELEYLGMLVESMGGTEKEIKNRVVEEMKVLGGPKRSMEERKNFERNKDKNV